MKCTCRFCRETFLILVLIAGIEGIAFGENTGTVLSTTGGGTIHRHDSTLALRPGTALLPEDSITTESDGRATIILPSGETIDLGPNSSIKIVQTSSRESRLSQLWSSVREKFSAGDETHAALGTLGAVRAETETPVLEDFPYLEGDQPAHRERSNEIESLFAAGAITESDAALLTAIVAEEYERYATAFQNYRSAMSPAGQLRLSGDSLQDESVSDWDRSIAVLIADLYVTNGYYDAAAAIGERFSLR